MNNRLNFMFLKAFSHINSLLFLLKNGIIFIVVDLIIINKILFGKGLEINLPISKIFIPAIVVPQIIFYGLISLDTLPYHLGYIVKILLVFYAGDELKLILIKGQGIVNICSDIVALLIFITIFSVLNIQALKKYRKI
jgi:hypothetical protein